MLALFALAALFPAFLLFFVQPLAAKVLLPVFGGAPAVWTTSMVFFQGALLAGYLYADLLISRVSAQRREVIHLILLAVVCVVFPLRLDPGTVDTSAAPVLGVFAWLLKSVGAPFVILAATAPLVQHWYTRVRKGDPYLLYAASNLGSFAALLAFPLLLEPLFGTAQLAQSWRVLNFGAAGAVAVCALLALRNPGVTVSASSPATVIPWVLRLRWCFASACGSALLVAFTLHITSDVAAIPLLWVVPLSLYLLSFVVAFQNRPLIPHAMVVRYAPCFAIGLASLFLRTSGSVSVVVPFICLLLFGLCLLCHGALSASKPDPAQLGTFYLWISIGGLIGGMFEGIAAPMIFNALEEVPLVIGLSMFLRIGAPVRTIERRHVIIAVLLVSISAWGAWIGNSISDHPSIVMLLTYGLPSVLTFSLWHRPVLFAASWGAVLFLAMHFAPGTKGDHQLLATRNFFGIKKVNYDRAHGTNVMVHGKILHGIQFQDEARRYFTPSYYHPDGPVGDLFRTSREVLGESLAVGVIGLGTGTIACHGRPNDRFVFFEIDPQVPEIASDPRYFTYLRGCGTPVSVEIGDGRRLIEQHTGAPFDLLVVDAFSSDSIPVHLLSREAVQSYLHALRPDGVVAFHISNQYLNLEPVVAALAKDAGIGVRIRIDLGVAEDKNAHDATKFMVLSKNSEFLAALTEKRGWREPALTAERPWSDDYSALLPFLQ